MRRLLCCLLVCCFVLFACSEEVTGPEPQMGGDAEDLATDPSFVCNEDPGTWVTLDGDAFSPLVVDAIASDNDDDVELPTVTLILRTSPTGEELDDDLRVQLDSPLGADDGDIRWIDDETLRFRLSAELELTPGVYDIEVTNPNGEVVTEHEAIGVLPRPTVEAIVPELTCVAQGERNAVVEGRDFLVGGEDYPTVSVDDQTYEITDADGCQGLHDVFGDHQLCSEASTTIEEDSLDAGTYDVIVENIAPADCPSNPEEDGVTLTIEDPPEVYSVEPTPVCSQQIDYEELEVEGQGFVVLDGDTYPTVSIGDNSYEPTDAGDCQSIDEAPNTDAQRCTELTVSIPAGDLDDEVDADEWVTDVDVGVENPEPVGCHSTEDTTLGVVPPPEITSVEPRTVCNNDGSVTFDAEGTHLFEIDGAAPHVVIDDTEYDAEPTDCEDVDGQDDTRYCAGLEVDVDDPSDFSGAYSMVAVNPEPIQCQSPESEEFYAAGSPSITDADPDGFCQDADFDGDLELFGQFLYDPQGEEPTVTIDGESIDFELSGCSPALDDFDLDLCGGISTTVPEDLIDDEFDVTVTASEPLACGSDTISLERTVPPTIDSVIPSRVCADGGTTLTVSGQDLRDDADYLLNGVAADDDDIDVNDDGTTATVTFESSVPGDWATFEVINPGDCSSTYEEELRVTDGPLPIFVDPPVVFDEMNTQVTVYAAGLYGGTVDEVELVHPDGATTALDHDYDDDRPQVLNATIPENMLDDIDDDDLNDGENAADFGVRLTDQEITCSNQSDELVTITSELTVAIDDIDPPFGAQDQSTGVEITAVEDPDDGQVQFEAVPRAYLNPVDGDSDALGREIRAVQFIDETELNGVVPSGLDTGFYDLIVVNPDGSVGVLDDAFQVTEERPPIVDSVSPASWPTGEAALDVDVEGANFRDVPDDPEVDVFCQQSGSDETDEDQLDQPDITVDSVTDSDIDITVDTGNLEALSACYMRVTNPDGTYAEYSPITTTNPAEKFLEFQAGNDFDVPRRAPTAFSGAPTRASRYLYVVGGDDGTTDTAISSGEFARLDRFGAPDSWSTLPYDLPSGRSMADGVRIDDFVYLVGGSDEGQTTDEILRTQVLDPLDVPDIVDVDIDVSDIFDETNGSVDGLDAGTYYYRVSAVYTDDDPANPGGESLASEPQPIQLPVDGVTLTISWDPPTDINHDIDYYAVYRNQDPDDAYGDESLIATVDAGDSSYTDDGTDIPDDTDQPLSQGSLGTWHQVATLNHARQAAGITFAPHPTVDDEYFIYAIGGDGDDGSSRDDYELFSVEVDGARDQWVGDATLGLDDDGDEMLMPAPRTELTAAVAYESNASAVADVDPQIFVFGGDSDGSTDTNIKVTTVGDDGHLESWTTFGPSQRMSGGARTGHAGAVLNNNLVYAGGGGDGSPGDDGFHTDVLCGGDCPPASIPSDFSNLSDLQMEATAWMGHVPFRGFWYFTGGVDAAGPTTTIQYSVAGATP